jgi:hypothetical protein
VIWMPYGLLLYFGALATLERRQVELSGQGS